MSIEKVRAYFVPSASKSESGSSMFLRHGGAGRRWPGVEGARIAKSLSFKVEDKPIIIVVAGTP